ncbi:hypothetical protein SAMN05421872_104294 [Nocardioides lianchengensis]|uniref:Uncharacterized protein n=1 Tax=Nocardioides lianchengensis TaxID=1045774 RepID=A0A1G6Q731_9ACTN|nr:hypothetical protein SAMN05421872_104294 [Nocardioides lianchengensis]
MIPVAASTDPSPPVVFGAGVALGVPIGAALLVSWWIDTTWSVAVATVGLIAAGLLSWRPPGRPLAVGLAWGTLVGALVLYAAFWAILPIGG